LLVAIPAALIGVDNYRIPFTLPLSFLSSLFRWQWRKRSGCQRRLHFAVVLLRFFFHKLLISPLSCTEKMARSIERDPGIAENRPEEEEFC